MKKTSFFFFLFSLSLMLHSCITLKLDGAYQSGSSYSKTNLSKEEVWNNVIDFFAVNGISITTIDKSSGLIVASKTSFRNNFTREKNDKPLDSNAYVVIPSVRVGFGGWYVPDEIVGDWNIRIKENETDGKTMVNINLVNLSCSPRIGGTTNNVPVRSTGVFEKKILDIVTN